MLRDRVSMRDQVNLAAFDQPSDLCDTELLGFLRAGLGSRGSPQFVILRTCVFSGDYVRLDLIPRKIYAGLPLAFMRELDQFQRDTHSHFEK